MATKSSLDAKLDLQKPSSSENNPQLPAKENTSISEVISDELAKSENDTSKSSSRKHKRKISSCTENEIPTKMIKNDPDVNADTKSKKVDKTKSDKLTVNSGSHSRQKHSLYDLDDSFQPPSKKIKSESDILRQDEGKKKHVRKRMKHLLQTVVDQMEFYFGDSNLSKDRFLRKIIDSSPDGYVDLSIFGNFNKLQSLHKDGVSLKVLSAAIRKSKMLQLNDDGTKVKRSTPIKEISQKEIDSRTVYVEHLPSHANHMWLRSIFCQCGKVVYVSLPVYKTTRMIKGFAFVEFETSEEAAKACMMLNNPLPVKSEEKPGIFPKGNKTLNRLQRLAPVKLEQGSDEENTPNSEKTEVKQPGNKKKKKKNPKKKKTHDSASDDNSTKSSITEAEPTEKKVDQAEGKKKKKKKKKKQNQPQDRKSHKDSEITSNMECNELTSAADVCQDSKSVTEDIMNTSVTTENETLGYRDGGETSEGEKSADAKISADDDNLKRKKSKKKRKSEKKQEKKKEKSNIQKLQSKKLESANTNVVETAENKTLEITQTTEVKLSRKERKRLRQEDIRRKKLEREEATIEKLTNITVKAEDDSEYNNSDSLKDLTANDELGKPSTNKESITADVDNEAEDKGLRKSDGSELTSILKSKKGQERKKVEFDPVLVTNEFVKAREIRKRKKPKKEKLHLRVITKDEWLSLKAEYIAQQKSHMAALKESLRELRQQENQGQPQGNKRVDLEDVFGTKRLKPSQDLKMAHVESLKFTPNVIVQWKCSHDMHRDKIRTMFKEMSGDSIAYIDAKEEAKFGYIRFKDEASAEEFSKLSRRSTSFMARVLPADQQEDYWKRANEDRMKKLGRKKHEKGAEKIARKVFERNKATFFQKPNHIVFNDDEGDDNTKRIDKQMNLGESRLLESHIQDSDQLPATMDAQLSTS